MTLSIIIPAYNEEKYIEKTLLSLQRQDYLDFETIVVCNGCDDSTKDIAKKFTKEVYEVKEPNVSKARNFGAEKSKHNHLIFLDADVILEKDVVGKIANIMQKQTCYGTTKGKGQGFRNYVYFVVKNTLNKFIPWCHGLVFCTKDEFFKVGMLNGNLIQNEWKDLFNKFSIKYVRLNCYVLPDDRRIKQWGLLKILNYWMFDNFEKDYKAVR